MENLLESTKKLRKGSNLSMTEAESCAYMLGWNNISDDAKVNFLEALSNKGETAEEVSCFARVFRALAVDPKLEDYALRGIDVCGTGGDGAGTFNMSTTVAFILAAMNIPVLKHGNRSITSNCGSADLMEAIGIKLVIDLPAHRRALKELNFSFFFAPEFHPVFKSIMPARKILAARGKKSIFNLLGPLINPAKPKYQLMGVYSKHWINPIAKSLSQLGLKSGMVVHGVMDKSQGLDELSCCGISHHKGFGNLDHLGGVLDIESLGLDQCQASELIGGSVEDNTSILMEFSKNNKAFVKTGLRNSIYLNASAALLCLGKVSCLREGLVEAKEVVESGALLKWINRVKAFYKNV